jgi:protein-tyrosine sulfotransferase
MNRRSTARKGDPRLVVLTTAARSGSTLLRLVLDAHPDVGCPGEANLPALLGALGSAWHTVLADAAGAREVAAVPPYARRSMRAALIDIMRCYCLPAGKRIYVDKSLGSEAWLGALHDIFPEAQFVFLYRHPLDVVASGIEASQWGFQAFGYAPFVARSVDNFVAPLLQHWNSQVWPTIAWAKEHQDISLQVKYEDLVGDTEATLKRIWDFLDVQYVANLPERALADGRASFTAGDYKVAFTDTVHQNVVGRGKRVPLQLIPDQLLQDTNEILQKLGYDRVRPGNAPKTGPSGADRGRSKAPPELVERLVAAVPSAIERGSATPELRSFALVVDDVPKLRWLFDLESGKVSRSRARADLELCGDCEDLIALLLDSENAASLLNAGRLRPRNRNGHEKLAAGHGPAGWSLVRPAAALLRRSRAASDDVSRVVGCDQ